MLHMATRVRALLLAAVAVGSLGACTSNSESEQPNFLDGGAASATPAAARSTSADENALLPSELQKRLEPAGYDVEEAADEQASLTARKAIGLARAFGSPEDIEGVYLARVSTPGLGSQTDSGFVPTFDNRLMWLVIATAEVEVGGTAAYVRPEQRRDEETRVIERTTVTFVDASTGVVERATSF